MRPPANRKGSSRTVKDRRPRCRQANSAIPFFLPRLPARPGDDRVSSIPDNFVLSGLFDEWLFSRFFPPTRPEMAPAIRAPRGPDNFRNFLRSIKCSSDSVDPPPFNVPRVLLRSYGEIVELHNAIECSRLRSRGLAPRET